MKEKIIEDLMIKLVEWHYKTNGLAGSIKTLTEAEKKQLFDLLKKIEGK